MRQSPARSAALLVAGLILAACGSSAKEDAAASVTEPAPTTIAPSADSTAVSASPTDQPAPSTAAAADTLPAAEPATTAEAVAPADATTVPAEVATTVPGKLVKPEVKIPAALPTELVITDLKEGTGPAAAEGDQVVVHYVGVRSADGAEFDNSYDRGEPFPVTLGQGGVIEGWEKGLVGARKGGRRQLDIPSDLAYGDQDKGDIIKAGDALTFVVDVVAVVPKSDPANAPGSTIVPAAAASEIVTVDLVEGTGDPIAAPSQAVVQIVGYQGDTGAQLTSTWEDGSAVTISLSPDGGTLPGLAKGVAGMKAGGRRQITLPYADAFGEEGNSGLGLPPKTDLVLIVDLIAVL